MKRFKVKRPAGCWLWIVERLHSDARFPAEFRAFDMEDSFREIKRPCSIVYINDTLQMLVAVDWLMERGWELDLSRCDKAFLSTYPVTAEATR